MWLFHRKKILLSLNTTISINIYLNRNVVLLVWLGYISSKTLIVTQTLILEFKFGLTIHLITKNFQF